MLYQAIKQQCGPDFAVFAGTGNIAVGNGNNPTARCADYYCLESASSPSYFAFDHHREKLSQMPLRDRPSFGVIHHSLDASSVNDAWNHATSSGCSLLCFTNLGQNSNYLSQLPDRQFLNEFLQMVNYRNAYCRPYYKTVVQLPKPRR
jgi:hypothetical protein